MVESAPLFIEYWAEGYVNFAAVKMFGSAFGLFSIVLAALSFFLGAYMYKLFVRRSEN